MAQREIVFILNSISNQRCIKRINEFVNQGYDVVVYAISRNIEIHSKIDKFDVNIIAAYSNNTNYIRRLGVIRSAIKEVISKHNRRAVYYLFGLDIAMMLYFLQPHSRYVYEESDLVHTYIGNSLIRHVLEVIDKQIIKKSLLSVFTSEGFIKYHFGENIPENSILIPNKLPPDIFNHSYINDRVSVIETLKIGFVGVARYKSVLNFAKTFLEAFPSYEFHFYGNISINYEKQFEQLKEFSNCYFHGPFISPQDLPQIYSSIDLVLSTYDVDYENVKYAEPNKLYEAVYFETPIIVSQGTFLSEKVESLGIGFSVNALNRNDVISLINNLSSETLLAKRTNASKLGKAYAINSNEDFFQRLAKELHN